MIIMQYGCQLMVESVGSHDTQNARLNHVMLCHAMHPVGWVQSMAQIVEHYDITTSLHYHTHQPSITDSCKSSGFKYFVPAYQCTYGTVVVLCSSWGWSEFPLLSLSDMRPLSFAELSKWLRGKGWRHESFCCICFIALLQYLRLDKKHFFTTQSL